MQTEQLGQELSDQDRVLLVFAYLGPLALVSLLASRREFIKWHAKQGLALAATLAALQVIALKPLQFIGARYTFWGYFRELFWAGSWLVVFGVVIAALVCIIRGLEGERFKLPLLGDLADRI